MANKHIELFENFFDREEPLNEGVDFKALGFTEIQALTTYQKKTKDYNFIITILDDNLCNFSITVSPDVEEKKFDPALNIETTKLKSGVIKYTTLEIPQEKIAETIKILDSK
jgi:hypothetical protein